MVTETQLNEAKARESAAKTTEPRALAASCDGERVHLELSGATEGLLVSFPVAALPFLSIGLPEQLRVVRALTNGEAIEWPELGEIVAVRGLLEHLTGLRSLSAMQQRGGSARTSAKGAAARANGAKGGRPRKVAA